MLRAALTSFLFFYKHPFNRRRRLRALSRFVQWQISSRLSLGPTVVRFIDDKKLCVSKGMAAATGNIYAGLFEFHDMSFVLHFLRPGDLFIDVGANVGSYTILAAATGAEVVAFEPIKTTFEALEVNVNINNLRDQVTAIRSAVGSAPGVVLFTTALGAKNHVVIDAQEMALAEQVPLTTLDVALVGNLTKTSLLVKIDVEGYESEVISGAKAVLANPLTVGVILELNGHERRDGVTESSIEEEITSLGFRPYSYDGFRRKLTPAERGVKSGGNVLFLRVGKDLSQRLSTARTYDVQGVAI